MPATPLHALVPWLPYVRWPGQFSFWAITIGAMVSDLEVLPLFALGGDVHLARGPMHSVVGVLTANAVLTMAAVYVLVPPAMRWVERRWPGRGLLRFAGQDLRADPRGLGTVYASAAFGGLTHILADLPTHAFNPVWWPWQTSPLTLVPFADEPWWDLLTTALWFAAFLAVFLRFWRR